MPLAKKKTNGHMAAGFFLIKIFDTLIFYWAICSIAAVGVGCSIVIPKAHPKATKGVLDASKWSFKRDGVLRLNGEWEFYWKKLYTPADFLRPSFPTKKDFLELPGIWKGHLEGGKPLPGQGYATFRLRVTLARAPQEFGIYLPNAGTAYRMWVNGRAIAKNGRVGRSAKEMIPQYMPQAVFSHVGQSSLEIVVQISNFYERHGGMWRSAQLGSASQINKLWSVRIGNELFLIGTFLLMGLYHLGLYFLRRKDRSTLFFSIFCMSVCLWMVCLGERLLIQFFPNFPWQLAVKLEFFAVCLIPLAFIHFISSVFNQEVPRIFLIISRQLCIGYMVIVFFLPPLFFTKLGFAWHLAMLVMILMGSYSLILALIHKREGAWLVTGGGLFFMLTGVSDILVNHGFYETVHLASFGVYALVLSQALFLAGRFSKAFKTVEMLSSSLEQKVKDRTQELERANQQLQALDRAKTQFFANISHELRTPLTLILSPLEALLSGEYGDKISKDSKIFEGVHHAAAKLLQLINQLLDMTKIEEGHLKLRLQKDDLRILLKEIVDYTHPLADRKEISVQLEVGDEVDDLYVDPTHIERAIVNIIANALKFTEPGGTVRILRELSAEEVQIVVSDTGCGIAEEKLEEIFDRFSQIDGSITRRYGGTGIGLAYAKEIVELHGGQITVVSKAGEGSVFAIHLKRGQEHLHLYDLDTKNIPVIDEETDNDEPHEWTQKLLHQEKVRFFNLYEATESRRVQRGNSPNKATKILVVEDNIHVLNFINLQLQDDHDVFVAENGLQGLELARKELPDVIVADYMMPEMDGLTMLRELRDDPKIAHIPVIILSAKGAAEDRIDGRKAGADIFLTKPFSPRELRAAIDQLLIKQGQQAGMLIQAQKQSLEVIVGGLAHEINNPLSYLKNAVYVIDEVGQNILSKARKTFSSEDDEKWLQKTSTRLDRMHAACAKGIERIEQVVELLRFYAQEGKPIEKHLLHVDSAVRDILTLIASKEHSDINLSEDLAAGEGKVPCIAHELMHAFSNVIQNAIEVARRQVIVRTILEDGRIQFEVEDDGPGIERDRLSRIFTPFYTTKEPGQGMGMGLAIVQQVVHRTGGSIAIQTIPSQGTKFKIILPAHVDEHSAKQNT